MSLGPARKAIQSSSLLPFATQSIAMGNNMGNVRYMSRVKLLVDDPFLVDLRQIDPPSILEIDSLAVNGDDVETSRTAPKRDSSDHTSENTAVKHDRLLSGFVKDFKPPNFSSRFHVKHSSEEAWLKRHKKSTK
uniref:Uncharacterized protein n=1 Tax=Moniliophthora roreri TaxID=221103 RepID=A0A0W0FWY2_MONRR